MILPRLRSATALAHRTLENRLSLFENVQTAEQYADYLQRFHAFLAPLEERLDKIAGLEAFALEKRRKAGLLERDLRHFGRPAPPPLAAEDLPEVRTAVQAAGILYVLEGSTLGGQVIARHFGPRLGLRPESGLAYHCAYGENTGREWQAFCAEIEQFAAANAEHAEATVSAAQACFEKLGDALCPGRTV